jgi:hypothetical protein
MTLGRSERLRAMTRRSPTSQCSDGEGHNKPVRAHDPGLQGDHRNFQMRSTSHVEGVDEVPGLVYLF